MLSRSKTINLLSYLYLGGIITAMVAYGSLPILYLAFVILAGLFILPDRTYLGLSLIIALTMVFERYFTLQGLVLDDATYKFYLLDAVILLSLLTFPYSHFIKAEKIKIIWGWPEKILAAWMVLVGLYLARSLFDINAQFATAFSSFKNYCFYPLLYLLTIHTINSGKKLKNLLHLIMLVATGLIAFVFLGFIRGNGLWTEFTPLSTAGTRYLAGTHAFYLTLALMPGATLLFYKRLRSTPLSLMVLAFWVLGVGVSLMRHLWLAVMVGLMIVFIIINREHKKIFCEYAIKISLGLVSLALVLFLTLNLSYFSGSPDEVNSKIQAVTQRAVSMVNLEADSSANWRQDTWNEAKAAWLNNPLYGVGFGRQILIDRGDWQNFEEIRNIHNSPLAILVQMGLVGLAVLGLLIIAVLLEIKNKIFLNHDLEPYYFSLIAMLGVFLFCSLFQPYLETNLFGLWFWLILGLLRTASLINKEQPCST